MPWALLQCNECGAMYRHYAVGEVERWIRAKMDPRRISDPAHFARQVKALEALCPYCREIKYGIPYGHTWGTCTICGGFGRDRRGNCKVCGGPPGELVSRTVVRLGSQKGKMTLGEAKKK
jgi:hypothetical protein